MVAYRVVSAINRGYPIAVFWLYCAAFVLALSLVFVFPPAPLFLLWLGLVGLVFVVAVAKVLGMIERLVARMILGSGACPRCGNRMETRRDETVAWSCAKCRTVFEPSGATEPTTTATPPE